MLIAIAVNFVKYFCTTETKFNIYDFQTPRMSIEKYFLYYVLVADFKTFAMHFN